MFIPIMGRAGSALNPDIIVGYKAALLTLATISFLCPLAMVMRKPMNLITALYMTTLITVLLVSGTKIGFPYSVEGPNYSPHRGLVLHTHREFYNKQGTLENSDSGYFMVNLDRNSPNILRGWVPEISSAIEITSKQCDANLYCGMPVYYPASSMLRINHWLPAPMPKLYNSVNLTMVHQEALSVNIRRVLFRAIGPDHMGVFISPSAGIQLTKWSLANGELLQGPDWKAGRPTYYIFHSQGKNLEAWEFWLDLEVPRSHYEGNELLDMAVTGHHIHGPQMKSSQFKEFLAQFPGWSYTVGWTAAYKAYKF